MSVTAPANNATVSGTVPLSATATDNVGVALVQFRVDGNPPFAKDTTTPYSVSWNTTTVANGTHTLTAVATDTSNNTKTSAPVTVTVANAAADTTAPTVSVTAPANNATVSGTVPLSATASDNVGVAGVQFLVDSAALGAEDTTAPYSVSWNTTTAGPHTLTAQARDAAGNTTSASVSVTVELAASKTQIALGASPDFLGANDSRIYVLNTGDPTVSVIDNSTNTVIATSEPLPAGGAMVVSPNGDKLYVAEYLGTHIHMLDAQTLTPTGTIDVVTTYGGTLALNSDGSRLYVGSTIYSDDQTTSAAYVSVVDTATRNVIGQIPLSETPGNVALSPDGRLLYVNGPTLVHVIDVATKSLVTSFSVGGQPADVAFSPDSSRAYLTDLNTGLLHVINTATSAVVATPMIDPGGMDDDNTPTGIAVSPLGKRIYVVKGDDIVVVDAVTNTVIGEIRVATDIPNSGAQSMTVDSDGTIYVTLEDTVVAVDVTSSTPM